MATGKLGSVEHALLRRDAVAERIDTLAHEAAKRDPSLAALLARLADAVRDGREREVEGYIEALNPAALAESITGGHSVLWDLLEVLRNVLVFAPIAVTWLGLSLAAAAYYGLIGRQPDQVSKPFLLLWEGGFGGVLPLNFSTLALIDASLIGVLIALSLALFTRSELRGRAVRARPAQGIRDPRAPRRGVLGEHARAQRSGRRDCAHRDGGRGTPHLRTRHGARRPALQSRGRDPRAEGSGGTARSGL